MVVCYLCRIIMFVAVYATEQSEVVGYGMTICALVPFIVVFSTVNREIHVIVVKGGGLPGILAVAQGTIRGEPGRSVVWIIHRVVVTGMASIAGIGGIVVITSGMTSGTIVGNGIVSPHKRPIVIMNGESSRRPIG